jgi:acyl transferase domain-containing protein/thioesterase domain-containing protein/acyl carrier protein
VENEFNIAVVGLSCRFPGARSPKEFWQNLCAGIESITRFSDSELLQSGVSQPVLDNPNYVKAAPVLQDPGFFDATFFGFTPAEARAMDPQHRILLELAHEALENAGCNPDNFPGRIGVFTGSAMNTYFMNSGLSRKFAEDYIPTLIGNDKDFLSTRLSYKLNLKGPSITIQTACSTSLVAVHLARQSLLSGETDLALAGAISVRVPHRAGYFCDGGGVVSPDGKVRAFDAGANGTVFGSGGGIIVLKRLADAIADGDTIHAVIKGSAANNDGSEKAGYTAPSVNSQADAVVEALANAAIDAADITYIEAHGSGTPIGDPIEVAALTQAFRSFTSRSDYCAIGSVKTNLGHLDAAAGIAGMIKTILALKHRQLPPTLNYNRPNPEIDFSDSPFYVNAKLVPWKSSGPRRAGVMSTGMGGTNAYVILEEAPDLIETTSSELPQLLPLSAKSEAVLEKATLELRDFLKDNKNARIEDVAYTLQTGRKAFAYRRFLVCADREDAIGILSKEKSKRIVSSHLDDSALRPVILLLPGIGDHYVGMGRELYEKCEPFATEVNRCAKLLEPHLGIDIREIIYPKNIGRATEVKTNRIDLRKMLDRDGAGEADPAAQKLNQTIYAQPALFTIEYALSRLWQHLGITPTAIVGHSMGEYVAACLAGVFSLEDALQLIARRAKLVNELPQAAMLAVLLPEAELLPLLDRHLSIALINGPNLCVVAGPRPEIAELERALNERSIITRSVQNGHAFHSRLLEPIVSPFIEEVRKVQLHEPEIPFISNVTGKWITKAQATDPTYWGCHTIQTARFGDALACLWQFKDAILLEAGPGKTLTVLANQHPDRRAAGNPIPISSLRHHYENHSDVEFLLHNAGTLWLSGVDITNLPQAKQCRKIPLPTYPFDRQNYWLEPIAEPVVAKELSIHKNSDRSKWFYIPSWKRTFPKAIGLTEFSRRKKQRWLVFHDEDGFASKIIDRLKAADHQVVTVKAGEAFQQLDAHNFILGAGKSDDYKRLIAALQANDFVPDHVIHAWTLAGINRSRNDSFKRAQDLGFYSLLFLARALARQNFGDELDLFVISNHIQEVHGNEVLTPEKSTLLGPCIVIPQEYSNIRVKSIDLELPIQSEIDELTIDRIFGEFFNSDAELFIAYRNAQRWVQTYEQVELNQNDASVLRERGLYLITGGLGNIGYEISKHLAKNYKARLVLVGRLPLPKRKLWETWITSHPVDDPITDKIRKITEVENLGGEVLYLDASVDDLESMRQVLDQAQQRFGDLHGVIHGAGVVGDQRFREIKDVDHQHGDVHFQVKAHALLILEELLEGKALDFIQLVSSLTSLLGGIGHAAYASSCIYMDSLARKHNRASATPWLSVNWDFWRTEDHAALNSGFGATTRDLGMSAGEAVAAMETILPARQASQLIVSTGDLNARINQWVKLESLHGGVEATGASPAIVPQRGASSAKYDPPRNETERRVAQVWQNAFGIEHIGINDHFSDLGGHSLLAIKIVSELRSAFRIDLPIRALFETPTVAELSACIQSQRNGNQPAPAIDRIRDDACSKPSDLLELIRKENPELLAENAFVLPRWFIQQTTWLEDPSNSDSAVYNYPLLLRIRGPLQEKALQQSLHEIVRRHETLRSVFRMRGAELVQIVVPQQMQALQVKDLSDLPMPERETRTQEIALNAANQVFDLARGPLLRSALIRLAPDDHILQLTTHQIVYDDWSTGILARELSDLYQAFAAGKASPLSEVTSNYGDFVRWQQKELRGQKFESSLSFWRAQLDGAIDFQYLPADFARPEKPTKCAAYESMVLPMDLADSLNVLSRQERVSLFMVLLAGFKCLLHRYSSHAEIGVGSCAANRGSPEMRELIGRFGNAMLLRTTLAGNPTFRELLMRVRETALTAYSKQDIPFGMLLREVAKGSDPIRKPPFQVMFILQNAPQEPPQVQGLSMNWSALYAGTAAYDLDVWIKTEPALEIVLEYSTDLFRAGTMKRILRDYEAILRTMATHPEACIGKLRISTKANAARLKPVPTVPETEIDPQRNGAARDDAQSKLVEIWESVFGISPIGVDQNFFELGGDSLLAARLFPEIEKAFAMDLPLATLLEAPTIRQLARIISSGNVCSLSSSLVAIQPSGTKAPLFCVPGLTGDVFFCQRLSRSLGTDQPVFGLRLQGLGGEAPHYSIEEMAAHYLSDIKTAQATGPYFLSGYCFGGLVAYEMARLLKKQGEEVALLVLFNTPTPDGLKDWPLGPACLRKRITYELKNLRSLPMHKKLGVIALKASLLCCHVITILKTALWRALPFSVKSGRNQRFLSVANINLLAAKTYQPGPYPGRITFFSTAELSSRYSIDPKAGWMKLAEDGIEVHDVPGENKSMLRDPEYVDALAAELRLCLARANDSAEEFDHHAVAAA